MNLSYYYEKGYDAANEDARAGSLPATVDAIDVGAVLLHLGLDVNGREARAIRADHGEARDVTAAQDAVLDGYRARVQS